ncbi:sodium-independent sulfate anion transporter-like isoform X1 [Patiria miniata]|uniref:STAS domain-containing protein n=1 Tax=Patiria miniata TaxID=46514 RepID=A0A914AXW1_PATMI|nr:sodium-independent sulfate anion transporter-like isoform X1 [Patiria miniata]XP_038068538.1 sodium-independent sulfate anion transporter-like isoform X1 [Patiria miniata]
MEGVNVRGAVQSYCSKLSWQKRFPISIWLPRYRLPFLLHDFIAGLTVALTVLPQGLAYASIAKLPIQYGLYSAYMGCFVYCFLGTSKDISVGPTAIMSLLVATFGKTDPKNPLLHDPAYAVLLAFFAGVVQFMLGFLHLGALTGFISAGVIAGFTSISAITIAFGQVKHILGIHFSSETFLDDLIMTFQHIKETNPWDVVIGICSIVILLALQLLKHREMSWEKDESYTPSRGQLCTWKFLWLIATGRNAVVVVVTALIAWTLQTQGLADKVTVTGPVRQGLPPFQVPDFSKPDLFSVLELGLAMIPLIGFLEAIAIGKSFARQNDYKVEPNQELIALGCCNLAGSFLSAYPVTGSFSRTAINSQSGVKSPAAGVVTGAVVILALSFLTPAFYYIPKSALASVIIVAVLKMVNYKIVLALWKLRKIELLAFAATCISSLFVGVAYGTAIGIAVDLLIMMYYIARPGIKVLEPLSSGQMARPVDVETHVQVRSTAAVVVQLANSVYYPSTEYIVDVLNEQLHEKDYTRPVIVDFSCVSGLDYTIVEGLNDALNDFKKANAELLFACTKPNVKALLQKADLDGMSIHSTVQDALRSLEEKEES